MSIPSESVRLVEFSAHGASPSFAHFQAFAQGRSLGWELEVFPAFDEALLAGARGARVEESLSDRIFTSLSLLPTRVRDLECFDSFLFDDGKWYPRALLFDALRELVVERVRDLDVRSCAYIIGTDELARIAGAVSVNLGFSRLYVVGEDEAVLAKTVSHLRRKFIGVEFHEVPAAAMTMQMVPAGLLINCEDLEENQGLLNDLSYFNFMKHNALVADIHLSADRSPLLEEALRAELRVLDGADIHLERDLLFLEKCGLIPETGAEAWRESYAASWKDFLKSHPLSSYKKRHP